MPPAPPAGAASTPPRDRTDRTPRKNPPPRTRHHGEQRSPSRARGSSFQVLLPVLMAAALLATEGAASAAPVNQCPSGTITASRTIDTSGGQLEHFIGPGCVVSNGATLTFRNSATGTASAPLTAIFSVTVTGSTFKDGATLYIYTPNDYGEYMSVTITGNTFNASWALYSWSFLRVYVVPFSDLVIANNTFTASTTASYWYPFDVVAKQRAPLSPTSRKNMTISIIHNTIRGEKFAASAAITHNTDEGQFMNLTVANNDYTDIGVVIAFEVKPTNLTAFLAESNSRPSDSPPPSLVTIRDERWPTLNASFAIVDVTTSELHISDNQFWCEYKVAFIGQRFSRFHLFRNVINAVGATTFFSLKFYTTDQETAVVGNTFKKKLNLYLNTVIPTSTDTTLVKKFPMIIVDRNIFTNSTDVVAVSSSGNTYNAPYYLQLRMRDNRVANPLNYATTFATFWTPHIPICVISKGNTAWDGGLCWAAYAPDPMRRCYKYNSVRALSTACYPTRTPTLTPAVGRTNSATHSKTHKPTTSQTLASTPTTTSGTTSRTSTPTRTSDRSESVTHTSSHTPAPTPTATNGRTASTPAPLSRTAPLAASESTSSTSSTTFTPQDTLPETPPAHTSPQPPNATSDSTSTAPTRATTTEQNTRSPSTSSATTSTTPQPNATSNSSNANAGRAVVASTASNDSGFVPPLALAAAAILLGLWAAGVWWTTGATASAGLFGLQLLALGLVVPCGTGVGSRWLLRVLLAPLDVGGSAGRFGRLAGSAALGGGLALAFGIAAVVLSVVRGRAAARRLLKAAPVPAVGLGLLELLLPGVVHEACLLLFGHGGGLTTGERVCGALVLGLCGAAAAVAFAVLPARAIAAHQRAPDATEAAQRADTELGRVDGATEAAGAARPTAKEAPPAVGRAVRWTTAAERAGAVPVLGRFVAPRWVAEGSAIGGGGGAACWVGGTALAARRGAWAAAGLASHGVLVTSAAAVASAAGFAAGGGASGCEAVAAVVGAVCLVHAVAVGAARGLRTAATDVLVPAQSAFAGLATLAQLSGSRAAPEALAVLAIVSAIFTAVAAATTSRASWS